MFFNSNLPTTSLHNILRIRSGSQIHFVNKHNLEFSNFAPLFNMFRMMSFSKCFDAIKSFEDYFDEQRKLLFSFSLHKIFVFVLRKYFQRSN